MNDLSQKYAGFERLMDEEEVWRDECLCFEDICRKLKIAPAALNGIIFHELGFYGAEVLEIYRLQDRFGDRGKNY